MRINNIISVLFVVCVGLVTGILVGYLVSAPARGALDAANFLKHQQIVHIYYQPMMQVLMSAALLSGLVLLVRLRKRLRSTDFLLAAIAFGAALTVFIITIVVNVPINNAMMTWNPAWPPANMRDPWATWENAHVIRTIVSVIAFLVAVVRLALRSEEQ